MNKRSDLSLSEKGEWRNWPLWLKGIFVLWPSLSTAYLFLMDTPGIEGSGDILTVLQNIEYQNYFISYFVGFWAINLVLLGVGWILVSVVSEVGRDKKISKSKREKVGKDKKKKPILLKKKG
ncbi:MAG: hypothetical protein ACQESD_04460 [Thermoplasmatota archaeon]